MSTLIPKEVTQKGHLGNGSWLAGTVVRVRTRAPAGVTNNFPTKSNKGKGKKQGKVNKGGQTEGFEIHICGGKTPADVMMVEAWETDAVNRLKKLAVLGKSVKLTEIELVQHSEKTTPWTTSRLPLYGKFIRGSRVEEVDTTDKWLAHHPITPLKSLQHVPEGRLVCVAGKLLPPGIQVKTESIGNDNIDIAKWQIRQGDDMINCTAWRDLAQKPGEVEVGEVMFLEAIKKVRNRNGFELRYISVTEQRACPDKVAEEIKDKTQEDTADGATAWTKPLARKRNYTEENAMWLSLSVCAKLLEGAYCPLTSLAHCPSVLISTSGAGLTYLSCEDCPKGLQDGSKTCGCKSSGTRPRWRCNLTLTDNTGQIQVTCFDAMEDVVKLFADDEEEKSKPEYFHESEEHVKELMDFLGARPFTALLSFEEDKYHSSNTAMLRNLGPTYQKDSNQPRHPLKPILRCTGPWQTCPPCRVADTTFDEGSGVSIVPGGGVVSFRALLVVKDATGTTTRESDVSPIVTVTRRMQCALAGDTASLLDVTVAGTLDHATKLQQPRKAETLLAIVSWRSEKEVSLLAWTEISKEEQAAISDHFAKECDVHKTMFDETSSTSLREEDLQGSPKSLRSTAMSRSGEFATPEAFSKRARRASD